MSTQIFKNKVPNEIIFNLLNKICLKNEKHWVLNNIAFKKGTYDNSITDFFELIKPYYHNSKKKYLERKLTYNNFTTIIRQICNFNKISYTSQIKYEKSFYEIIYIIFYDT
jgi:hypothetical protein